MLLGGAMDTASFVMFFLFLCCFALFLILKAIERAHAEFLAEINNLSDLNRLWLVEIRDVCQDIVFSQNRRLANKSLRFVFGRYRFYFATSRYDARRLDYKNKVISASSIGKFQIRSKGQRYVNKVKLDMR